MRFPVLTRLLTVTVPVVATLAIGIPSASATTTQTTQCVDDASYSTQLCLGYNAQYTVSGGNTYVQLLHVQASATNIGGAGTRILQLKLGAVVNGRCISSQHCGTVSTGKLLVTANNPGSGTHSAVPPWSQDYVDVSGYEWQCAVASITWAHGTGKAQTYSADLCFGAAPDSLSLSDRERGLT
jgi:hypothetical protein